MAPLYFALVSLIGGLFSCQAIYDDFIMRTYLIDCTLYECKITSTPNPKNHSKCLSLR